MKNKFNLIMICIFVMCINISGIEPVIYDYAVYLGVLNYGNASSSYKDSFQYRFNIAGTEKIFTIANSDDYKINNQLIEGEIYKLTTINNNVVDIYLQQPENIGEIYALLNGKFLVIGEYISTYSTETMIYSIKTSAGGAVASLAQDIDGKFAKIYNSNLIYLVDNYQNPALPVEGIPGERTLKNFIATAMMPVGRTLYIYGGGWNWQDTGSSIQATTIGLSPTWYNFFDVQDEYFKYRDDSNKSTSYYPFGGYNEYHYLGLDCSGYVGWVVYNTMNTISGNMGYVTKSSNQANMLANNYGYGTFSRTFSSASDFKVGDIFSMNGHVWISLGACQDGSILFLHSTPSNSNMGYAGGGVQLSAIGNSKQCEAYLLANEYMKNYFSEWSSRYDIMLVEYSKYTSLGNSSTTGKFSWHLNQAGLLDPEGITNMSPREVLEELFSM